MSFLADSALVLIGLLIVFATFVALVLLYNFLCWLVSGPGRHQSKLKLKDRTVLITGASHGIGRALAEEFHAKGAKVIVASRNVEKLRELCEELHAKNAGVDGAHQPVYCELDLERVSEWSTAELRDKLLAFSRDGKTIDVIVNNAGIINCGSVRDTPLEVHRRLMEVNFFGHVAITRALLDNIPEDGAIVHIGSMLGRFAIPYHGAYAASKHAMQAFYDAMRGEERHKLHILTVSAGYVNSGMSHRAVTANGSPAGSEDRNFLKGYSTQYAAKEIVKATVSRKSELLLASFLPRLAISMRIYTPNLLWRILHKRSKTDDSTPKSEKTKRHLALP